MYKFTAYITMEEHWVYLASIGFFVVLAYLILGIKKQKMIKIVSSFFIIIYAISTVIYSLHWKDEIGFYNYNLKFIKPSLSIIPRLSFIPALYTRGFYQEAIDEANFILSVHPENWVAYIGLGDTFKVMGKYPEAEEAYKNAVRIDSLCWQANRRLKLLAEETGQVYREEVNPGLSPIEAKIISHIKMGEFDQASEILYHELSISPNPKLYTFAGVIFGKTGAHQRAIDAFNLALKLDPENLPALHNLSVVYRTLGQFEKAKEIQKRIELIK